MIRDLETVVNHCKNMYLNRKEFTPVFENAFNQIYASGSLFKDDAVTALPRILSEVLQNSELSMEERTALSLLTIDSALDVYGLSEQQQPNFDHCLLGIVAVSQGDLNKITEEAAYRIESKDTCGILFQIVDIKTGNRLNISALTGNGDVPSNDEMTALTPANQIEISIKNIMFNAEELQQTVVVQAVHYEINALAESIERGHADLTPSSKLFIAIQAR